MMPQLRNAHKLVLFILIAILLTIQPVSAQSQADIEGLMADYIQDQTGSALRSHGFSNLKFKGDSNSDLYLTLYNEIVSKADESAVNAIAATTGSSRGQIRRTVNEGVTGEIAESEEILEDFEREREFFRLLGAQENETLAFEIFTNGTTSDADFDLLKDLNKIEKILFGEETDSQFGPSLNRPTAVEMATTTFERETQSITEDEPDLELEDDQICQIDNELTNSLIEHEEAEAEEVEADTQDRKPLRDLVANLRECDSIFCLRIERTYKTEYAYFPTDQSCISCLVEELSNSTNELVTSSLIPHKVTGNFGEPNVCKKSFGLNILSMRISLLQRPIIPNDTTEYVQELNPGQLAEQNREQSTSTVGEVDTADRIITNQTTLLGDEATPGDLAQEASLAESLESEQEIIQANFFEVNQDLNSSSALIQTLHQRMQTMNSYFESYQDILSEIQQTLADTLNKPSCSEL